MIVNLSGLPALPGLLPPPPLLFALRLELLPNLTGIASPRPAADVLSSMPASVVLGPGSSALPAVPGIDASGLVGVAWAVALPAASRLAASGTASEPEATRLDPPATAVEVLPTTPALQVPSPLLPVPSKLPSASALSPALAGLIIDSGTGRLREVEAQAEQWLEDLSVVGGSLRKLLLREEPSLWLMTAAVALTLASRAVRMRRSRAAELAFPVGEEFA